MSREHTKIAVGVFDKLAKVYQDKFMDVSLYHDTLNLFCSCIETTNPHILDIACGPGNITSYLLKRHPGFKILGIDLAPAMIELAKINNPDAQFEIMDCRDINAISQKYEGIIVGFCLPYLSKTEAQVLISDACGLLAKGGVLYVSTMEDDYSKSGLKSGSTGDQIYMYYHQEDYLVAAFKQNGLTVINIDRIEYPGGDGTPIVDLVIIGKKE